MGNLTAAGEAERSGRGDERISQHQTSSNYQFPDGLVEWIYLCSHKGAVGVSSERRDQSTDYGSCSDGRIRIRTEYSENNEAEYLLHNLGK
jgi:hypothetical protein